jgi:hypothetical protein
MLDGRITAAQKPNGDIQPIAIQEVWLRTAVPSTLAAGPIVRESLRPAPLQLGVAPGGTEAIRHALFGALDAVASSSPPNRIRQ